MMKLSRDPQRSAGQPGRSPCSYGNHTPAPTTSRLVDLTASPHSIVALRYNGAMALRLRRPEYAPRFEMTPLLDVIFLLLTFFILVWPMMVRAEVLRFRMTAVDSGRALEDAPLVIVSIDAAGGLFLNDEPIARAALGRELAAFGRREPTPPLHVVPERGQTRIDRLPVLVDVVQMARDAGIQTVNVVGEPAGRPGRLDNGDERP